MQRDRREREWQGLAAVDRLDGCSMTGKLWSVLIGVSGSHLSIRKCTTRHKAQVFTHPKMVPSHCMPEGHSLSY